MNVKNNQRAKETDERIVRAVYQVMLRDNRPISKVTVREVCELAGINRSTFYAHYLDVFDVLEQVEKNMSEQLTKSFMEQIDRGCDLIGCFESLFRFIKEYQGFYRVYLSENNRAGVIRLAWGLIEDRLDTVSFREFSYQSERELEYHGAFFLFGLTAIIRQWVENGCPETPEEMCQILLRQYTADRSPFDWVQEKTDAP